MLIVGVLTRKHLVIYCAINKIRVRESPVTYTCNLMA